MSELPDAVRDVLEKVGTIAIVGLSSDPSRPSFRVAQYLLAAGCDIVPVNPRYESVLGLTCYPDLGRVPRPVHTVDVFRRSEDCLPVAEAAIAIGARALWLQEGIRHPGAEQLARRAGLRVVADRCLKVDYAAFIARG